MRVGSHHLSYCSNVHPGESWVEVCGSLQRHLLPIRRQVTEAPFGIGLRLSALAAKQAQPEAFADWLAENDLYVFTLNGFPYGPFHGRPIKEAVYQPDWADPARLAYTERLVALLARWLPRGVSGSISTVPVGYGAVDREAAAAQLLSLTTTLTRLRSERGIDIRLGLEPEPACILETTKDAIDFFEDELLTRFRMVDIREEDLRHHLGMCLDTCHAAVGYESPGETLALLAAADLRLPKVQLSAGLRVPALNPEARAALRPFAEDDVYLHQTVTRDAGELSHYLDLPEALAEAPDGVECRVHFHVPVFTASYGVLESTQSYLKELLRLGVPSPHLEVETYTWDVLPVGLRSGGVEACVARELLWSRAQLMR